MLAAMTRRTFIFLALLAALARLHRQRAGTRAHAFEQPESESGFQPKPLVTAKKHMVVAAHPLAAEAGLAMLRKGGSAVDAGIAVQMVLNLVEPQSSGIGGGAYHALLGRGRKTLASIDGRETAPAAATPELFLDAEGKPLPREAAIASGLSVGVPGVLAALEADARQIRQAPLGGTVRAGDRACPRRFPGLAPPRQDAGRHRSRQLRAGRARLFLRCARQTLAGRLQARTIRRSPTRFATIARDGPKPFYRRRHRRRHRQARCRTIRAGPASSPLRTSPTIAPRSASRSARFIARISVCGTGPPSSGAVTVGQVLGLSSRSISAPRRSARVPAHVIAEAERLAFADRARYLADTDFVAVPVAGLLDPTYLAERRALIDPDRAQRDGRGRIAAQREARRVRQRRHARRAAAPAKSPSSTTRATPSP